MPPIEFELNLIHYILDAHGVHPDENGQYRCPIAPHVDQSPSANVWEGDRGDALFGCWSHPGPKRAWKAAELAQALNPSTFQNYFEAIRYVEKLAIMMRNTRWQGPVSKVEREKQALDTNILRIRREMARGSSNAIETFLSNRPDLYRHSVSADYLRDWWQVSDTHPDYPGELYIPYFDRQMNDLPCAKHRPLGMKPLSVKGSDFSNALYGLWMDSGQDVILCEGETDTWASSLQFPDLLALGLPNGASRPRPGQLALIESRSGLVAFDNDDAGNMAAEQWLKALGSGWGRLPLPEGTDFATGWNP